MFFIIFNGIAQTCISCLKHFSFKFSNVFLIPKNVQDQFFDVKDSREGQKSITCLFFVLTGVREWYYLTRQGCFTFQCRYLLSQSTLLLPVSGHRSSFWALRQYPAHIYTEGCTLWSQIEIKQCQLISTRCLCMKTVIVGNKMSKDASFPFVINKYFRQREQKSKNSYRQSFTKKLFQ